jgi:centromeric protein E
MHFGIAFLLLPSLTLAHKSCVWKDEKGHLYDLSPMQKSANYELVDEKNSLGMFTMVYQYNFCSRTVSCNGKEAAAVEAL